MLREGYSCYHFHGAITVLANIPLRNRCYGADALLRGKTLFADALTDAITPQRLLVGERGCRLLPCPSANQYISVYRLLRPW